jgi:hypothetical protein
VESTFNRTNQPPVSQPAEVFAARISSTATTSTSTSTGTPARIRYQNQPAQRTFASSPTP